MRDLTCIAMVHIRKCSYLGLLCDNASYDRSILCRHGIHSITNGNASYGNENLPLWIQRILCNEPWIQRGQIIPRLDIYRSRWRMSFIFRPVSQPPTSVSTTKLFTSSSLTTDRICHQISSIYFFKQPMTSTAILPL